VPVDPKPDQVQHEVLPDQVRALLRRVREERPFNIGFPGAVDVDHTAFAPVLACLLNNIGDPMVDGVAANHTKAFEREVVDVVADLVRAPADDRWGYVTSGGTEATLYALHLARTRYPDAVVYASSAAHTSVAKAVDLLAMPVVRLRADDRGQLVVADLGAQLRQRADRPAVVVATIGTTMTEAVDDVRGIRAVLDAHGVHRRFVHADAALSGIPLALLDPADRPGFDFGDGADAVSVSGHKFLGCPLPCGVVVVRNSHRIRPAGPWPSTGSPDTTISGSRSGHAPLLLWAAIHRYGLTGLRHRAEASRALAGYALGRLLEIGWPAYRHEHACTVVLRTPPDPVTKRWVLATEAGWSHIVCMPGVRTGQIDAFVADLAAS
jgi:histidine decarboxylase